jgi:KRAB domain-containing zinc finger protein
MGRIRCLVCEKWFKRKRFLLAHAALHNDLLLLVCRVCGSIFRDIEVYKEHRLTHDDRVDFIYNKLVEITEFVCSFCGKEFNSKQCLRQHQIVHGTRKFKCDKCGKDFKRKSDIQSHLKCHSIERNFQCSSCGMTYKNKRYLSHHEKECRRSME